MALCLCRVPRAESILHKSHHFVSFFLPCCAKTTPMLKFICKLDCSFDIVLRRFAPRLLRYLETSECCARSISNIANPTSAKRTFDKMRIRCIRPIQRLVHNKFPIPPLQLISMNTPHIHLRSRLPNIHGECE